MTKRAAGEQKVRAVKQPFYWPLGGRGDGLIQSRHNRNRNNSGRAQDRHQKQTWEVARETADAASEASSPLSPPDSLDGADESRFELLEEPDEDVRGV